MLDIDRSFGPDNNESQIHKEVAEVCDAIDIFLNYHLGEDLYNKSIFRFKMTQAEGIESAFLRYCINDNFYRKIYFIDNFWGVFVILEKAYGSEYFLIDPQKFSPIKVCTNVLSAEYTSLDFHFANAPLIRYYPIVQQLQIHENDDYFEAYAFNNIKGLFLPQ